MKKTQIVKVKEYMKSKYAGRNTLKLNQISKELLMSITQVKELKNSGALKSSTMKSIATFIVNNPAQIGMTYGK